MDSSENNKKVAEINNQDSPNKDYSFPDLFNNANDEPSINITEPVILPIAKTNEELLYEFESDNSDLAQWWNNTDYEFALSLKKSFLKNGKLSDKQLIAAKKCLQKSKSNKDKIDTEQNDQIDNVGLSGISELISAMWRARRNGVKEPKMRLFAEHTSFNVVFDNDENSKYKNSLKIVSDEGKLLGRILGKTFYKSNYTSDEIANQINDTCSNANKSAISYGRKTGSCSCCGRPLNNEESVRIGIGPVCRTHFFG